MQDAPAVPEENELLARQQKMLGELAELGLHTLRFLGDQMDRVRGSCTPQEAQGLGQAHDRVSRAVRLAFLMQSDLADRSLARSEKRLKTCAEAHKQARERRVIQVMDAVRHATAQTEKPYAAARMVRDRLETDSVYGDIVNRPFAELIDQICKDIGVIPEWDKRLMQDWAVEREELDDRVLPCERQRTGGLANRIRFASTAQRAGGGIPPPPTFDASGPQHPDTG